MPVSNARLLELVHEINGIAQSLSSETAVLSRSARDELIRSAEKLAIAAREPEENLYHQATQTAQNFAIRTAIGMGVFEAVPSSGEGISTTRLATLLNVDEALLVRVMRACASAHLFHETSRAHHVHNAVSATFLVPSNRDMFQQMYDFVGRAVYSMPYYLESRNYQNPTDYNDSAFHYGHQTQLGFFEYLMADPQRIKVFNSGMRSTTTVGSGVMGWGPFPIEAEVALDEIQSDDVLIVDVGGGRGQALESIRAAFPHLQGRMILQDVADVTKEARAAGLSDRIETKGSSFFEPQEIHGAYLYYFRRVFHDWSDEPCVTILRHTKQAMTARSRILIVDTVVPDQAAPRYIALQDINMMSFGGMERTKLQWEKLMEKAGLKIKKFWTNDQNLQQAIEVVLP